MDGAVSYAEHCIRDFSERTETFATSHVRYGVVLRIRCAAKQQEEEEGAVSRQNDDNGSLYSVATDLSNTILRSTMSGYSVGSVTSVSSVFSSINNTLFLFMISHLLHVKIQQNVIDS